jgi:hypothetical protein
MQVLIDEYPLVVLPTLAAQYGLNEAIVIQQIHYWTSRKDPMPDGHSWVYNSVREWKKQFPFWSERTIFSILKKLRESGMLIAEQKSNNLWDKTLYYRLNYKFFESTITQILPNRLREDCVVSNKTDTNSDTNDLFDKFWKSYPRKIAKPSAIKAWKKLKVTEVILNQMISAINVQGLASRDQQYIPHPATWLNDRRWEDEITQPNVNATMGRRVL